MNRILWNKRGHDIDEVVLHDVTVHVEQMSARCWWIGMSREGDPDKSWSGNFTCDQRGRMRFSEQESGIDWEDDDSHEYTEDEEDLWPNPDEIGEWRALIAANNLHLLPPEALVAGIKNLAARLLTLTADSP